METEKSIARFLSSLLNDAVHWAEGRSNATTDRFDQLALYIAEANTYLEIMKSDDEDEQLKLLLFVPWLPIERRNGIMLLEFAEKMTIGKCVSGYDYILYPIAIWLQNPVPHPGIKDLLDRLHGVALKQGSKQGSLFSIKRIAA